MKKLCTKSARSTHDKLGSQGLQSSRFITQAVLCIRMQETSAKKRKPKAQSRKPCLHDVVEELAGNPSRRLLYQTMQTLEEASSRDQVPHLRLRLSLLLSLAVLLDLDLLLALAAVFASPSCAPSCPEISCWIHWASGRKMSGKKRTLPCADEEAF